MGEARFHRLHVRALQRLRCRGLDPSRRRGQTDDLKLAAAVRAGGIAGERQACGRQACRGRATGLSAGPSRGGRFGAGATGIRGPSSRSALERRHTGGGRRHARDGHTATPAMATATPESAPSPESMARDLKTMGQQIEQLKANIEQLKAEPGPDVPRHCQKFRGQKFRAKNSEAKTAEPGPRPRAAAFPTRPVASLPPRPIPAPPRKPRTAYLPPPAAITAPSPTYAVPPALPPPPLPQPVVSQPAPLPEATYPSDDGPVIRPPLPLR